MIRNSDPLFPSALPQQLTFIAHWKRFVDESFFSWIYEMPAPVFLRDIVVGTLKNPTAIQFLRDDIVSYVRHHRLVSSEQTVQHAALIDFHPEQDWVLVTVTVQ